MDRSLEVTNVKNELTVKQESDYLVQSETYIKPEPQEVENEFPIIASTSNVLYSNYDMKFEAEEPLIKIECEGMLDEIMQDPLDVSGEIKVEEHFPIDLDQAESKIKTEPTDRENEENLLESDEDFDSQGSGSNQDQKLLIGNDSDRKDKKYVCNVCNKTFTLKSNLDRHLRIHTGEKPFKCNTCKKSFNVKSTLKTHMFIHSDEKAHICDVCSKVFRHKSTLNEHKLMHSGKKHLSCNECGKSFTQTTSLVRHKRIHTGNKPYTCDLCKKAFVRKTHLTEHRRTHTGEKPYFCDICNKSYAAQSNLNQHKKNHKN